MSGGRGTFDGQHWREELLRKRTKEALERYPAGERRLHYNEEYKRQTLIYNQERDAKKRAKYPALPDSSNPLNRIFVDCL